MKYLSTLVFLFAASFSYAQDVRYELGRKVIAFEKEWDKSDSREARKRSVEYLQTAVNSFFSLKMPAVALSMTEGRYALLDKKMTPKEKWAESLYLLPERRLLDAKQKTLKLEVKTIFDSKQPVPDKAELSIVGPDGKIQRFKIEKVPQTVVLALPGDGESRDFHLSSTVEIGDTKLDQLPFVVSFVKDRDARLADMKKTLDEAQGESIELHTARRLYDILRDLAQGETLETDYPAARFFEEIDLAMISARKKEAFYTPGNEVLRKVDQLWLSFKVENEVAPTRFYVPEEAKNTPNSKWPLVVALHGAGGSENMFFDAYGDGCCRKECEKRGWFMLCTRGGFTGAPPVAEIVEQLQTRYPIDSKRIYLLGHSMGSAQAFGVLQAKPEKYAALAGLGGAGSIRKSEAFQKLPIFVGCGKADFAYRGSKALVDNLKTKKAEKVTFKEYEDVEHLAIVRVAIDDVFKFFEDAKRE